MTDNEIQEVKYLCVGQHITIKCPDWVIDITFVDNETFIRWLDEMALQGLVYVHPLQSNDGAIFRKVVEYD